MALLFLIAAWAAEPRDVLLVITPGVDQSAFTPWVEAMQQDGHTVKPVSFPCAGVEASDMADQVAKTAEHGSDWVVAAHGLGATVALMAAERVDAERYVLLGPVLTVNEPVKALRDLAEAELPEVVDLSEVEAPILLGDPQPALSCVSRPFALAVQSWIRGETVPVDLAAVEAPVWIGAGLLDEVAAMESLVPASRLLSNRRLVRLGVNRLDPQDFRHGELLTHPAPIRAATTAVSGTLAKHDGAESSEDANESAP